MSVDYVQWPVPEMAVSGNVGPQSPLNRNLERLFEEAQISGELKISSRRLREFPKIAAKYNLSDTVFGDLSKNKFPELPAEVTRFSSLEKLVLYHNVIRFIPDTVMYLQNLTYLDISRNQLSVLPTNLCKLPLQVLLVNHNRLVSLPEEINQLTELIELDASCNQLSHLPVQLGDLQHLQALSLRKNFLVEIPKELMYLKLITLDISLNRVTVLPVELRFMVSLVELCVEHNPLTSPPAYLCTRGRIHIFKFLEIEAVKEDRKRGILEGGGDCGGRRLSRKPSNLPDTGRFLSNDARRRRFTFDNGFPTSDPTADQRWPRNDTTSEHHSTTTNGNAAAVVAVTSQTAPTTASPMSSHQSPKNQNDEDDGDDEKGNEERRRAARKILEQQMVTQEERMPTHSQTYREYKEALRQQRGNVYKYRDSSHTPSPDTPPSSTYSSVDLQDRSLLNMNGAATTEHRIVDTKINPKDPSVFPYVKPSPPPSLSAPSPVLSTRHLSTDPAGSTSPYRTMAPDLATIESNSSMTYRSPSVSAVSDRIPATNRLSRKNSQTSKYSGTSVPSATPGDTAASNNNGHLTPTHSNPPTHSIETASFTVRREMERHREEMEQIQQLRQCIELRLKVTLPDDLGSALMDGVVLCHLANHVRPRSVGSIHVPSPAVPKLTVAKCRRNVENFIEACRRIGVPEDRLCSSPEVLERRNLVRIAITVSSLMGFHRGRPSAGV